MHIAAGIISTHDRSFVLSLPETPLIHFQISVDELSETELIDSASSSPGRYVAEVLRRLRRMNPHADAYLAFNPLLEISPEAAQAILLNAQRLEALGTQSFLFTDTESRQPLAYMLLAEHVDACPPAHLGLLTTTDVNIDSEFLGHSFFPTAVSAPLRWSHDFSRRGDFHPSLVHPTYLMVLRHAMTLLAQASGEEARRELIQKTQRVAVLSYHAGDILLLLQAMTLEETPFTAVLVPRDYEDIVRYVCPQIECLVVDLPVPNRGANASRDEFLAQGDLIEHFLRSGADPRRFFHLLRPCYRNYNLTHQHIREMLAFALGGPGHRQRALLPLPDRVFAEWSQRKPQSGRVLLQFDAGWPLKRYPLDSRRELLDLLLRDGFEPVLLGSPEPSHPQVRAEPYRGLCEFRKLLASAEALISCDSFPGHFANYAGVPVIMLFGSTRPQNSRPLESARARFLHHPLPCVPCGGLTTCPQYGGQTCHAHARASEILDTLRSLLLPPGLLKLRHPDPVLGMAMSKPVTARASAQEPSA